MFVLFPVQCVLYSDVYFKPEHNVQSYPAPPGLLLLRYITHLASPPVHREPLVVPCRISLMQLSFLSVCFFTEIIEISLRSWLSHPV
jgi:hypothetical protein